MAGVMITDQYDQYIMIKHTQNGKTVKTETDLVSNICTKNTNIFQKTAYIT